MVANLACQVDDNDKDGGGGILGPKDDDDSTEVGGTAHVVGQEPLPPMPRRSVSERKKNCLVRQLPGWSSTSCE